MMFKDIEKCISIMEQGGIILYPTDTVWGIGCDAMNQKAIQKIIRLKKRANEKQFIVLMHDIEQIKQFINPLPSGALNLILSFQKPTTVIFPNANHLSPLLISPLNTLAIRIPQSSEFCMQLLKQFTKPIVSTSANIAGKETPVAFTYIDTEIVNNVDYVVRFSQEDNMPKSASEIIQLNEKGMVTKIR